MNDYDKQFDEIIDLDINYISIIIPENAVMQTTLTKGEALRLTEKYGSYNCGWYFIDTDTIKAYDNDKEMWVRLYRDDRFM